MGLTEDGELEWKPTDTRFGPFDRDPGCGYEYGGIEETCTNEATHYTEYHHHEEDVFFRMYRCDEHGFPWLVRERQRQELGRPVKCEMCPQVRGVHTVAANEVAYVTEPLETQTGDEEPFHICGECRGRLKDDIDVESV